MPQMAPLCWICMSPVSVLCIVMLLSLVYFMPATKLSKISSLNPMTLNLKIKW